MTPAPAPAPGDLPRATVPERFPGFDVLRIFAAAAVIISHSMALVGRTEPTLFQLGGMPFNLGGLAVATFFVLSGFLISASWRATPAVRAYAAKRVFRIWPALIVVVAVSALVLGPLVTSLTPGRYFTSHLTWHYIGANVSMHPTSYLLPGVFHGLPLPIVVNGPLWTLPYEVTCYGLVLALGLTRVLRRGPAVLAAFVASLVVASWTTDGLHRAYWQVPGLLLQAGDLAVLAAWFLAGAVLQRYHSRIPRHILSIGVAAALVIMGRVATQPLLFIPGVSYLVIRAGMGLSVLRRPAWLGDPSYGMYLWGWPIQQTLMWSGVAGASWVLLSLEALPLALLAGVASWRVVERPAIGLGRRLGSRRSRRPDRASPTGPTSAPIP